MTYFDLCKQVCNYKTNEGVHNFCNFAKWYCIYNKLEFNETNVKKAFKVYLKKIK